MKGGEERIKKTTFRPLGFLRSDLSKPSGRNVVFFLLSSPPFTLYLYYHYTLFQTKLDLRYQSIRPGSLQRCTIGNRAASRRNINGACAHYVMVSKFQWKPFWLATQPDPQNDWTGWQNSCELRRICTGPIRPNAPRTTIARRSEKPAWIGNHNGARSVKRIFARNTGTCRFVIRTSFSTLSFPFRETSANQQESIVKIKVSLSASLTFYRQRMKN